MPQTEPPSARSVATPPPPYAPDTDDDTTATDHGEQLPGSIPLARLPARNEDALDRRSEQRCRWCFVRDDNVLGQSSRLVRIAKAQDYLPAAYGCLDCFVKRNKQLPRPGSRLDMADGRSIAVCLWCGHPAVDELALHRDNLHLRCSRRYSLANMFFGAFFTLQQFLCGAIVGMFYNLVEHTAYPQWPMIVTTVPAILLTLSFLWKFSLESDISLLSSKVWGHRCFGDVALMLLYVGPTITAAARYVGATDEETRSNAYALLVLLSFLGICRFIAVTGGILLACGCDVVKLTWRRYRPWWIRVLAFPPTAAVCLAFSYETQINKYTGQTEP